MQWGRNDQSVTASSTTTKESSNGAPIGTYALVKGGKTGTANVSFDANAHFGNTSPGSRANVDVNMYGNTTIGAFVNGMAVGVFGVNTSVMQSVSGNVIFGYVTYSGTGYAANTANFTPTPTNGGSGASINAIANSTTQAGKITGLNIVAAGSGYIKAPTLAIPAPAAIQVGANSTYVNASANVLLVASANSLFQVNDHLTYVLNTGNTSIVGLTGNTQYYVSFVNSSALALSAAPGGANIQLTANGSSTELGHHLQGDTATGYVDVSEAFPQVTHAGWVVRREGTGGRAGRVTFETLVAMGSLGAQSAPYGTPATVASNSSIDSIV
jgi:hypothetical protein